jgi:hypothetical protein
MTTKRTPIGRSQRPTLTPKAIEVYAQMRQLEWGSDEWYDLLMIVHRELRCAPWQIPCLCDEPGASPWDRLAYQRDVALERAVEFAARQQRKAAAPA